jgi:Zn-dependent protease
VTQQLLYQISVWVLPALFAITLHEAAHGYAAERFGDDTARRMGRVSMNPFRHIDPFGTVLLPAFLLLSKAPFLFGYAKPVPVNFARLWRPRRDMVFVAAAGPAMNLILALGAALLYHGIGLFSPRVGAWVADNLENAIWLNVLLAVFNMLPIPPLDGGRVAVGLLPDALAFPLARLERVGIFVVIGALFLVPYLGRAVGLDVDPFAMLILGPAEMIAVAILTLAGHA